MKKFIFEHSDLLFFIIGVLSGFGINIITNQIEFNIYWGIISTFIGIGFFVFIKYLLGNFNESEYFLIYGNWEKKIFNEIETWLCKSNDEYQLILGDTVVSNFSQSWIKFPDMKNNKSINLILNKNGNIINQFIWLMLDGGRVFIPFPDYDSKNNFYYFKKDSLKYKMMYKIGDFGQDDDSFEELFSKCGIKIL